VLISAQIPLCWLCDKVRDKFATKSRTQIMEVCNRNHIADFHDLCLRQVCDFVANLSRTLSLTFPVHCNRLNSIITTQMGLSWTCHGLCRDGLCPRLSPRGSFGQSWRNGIWAFPDIGHWTHKWIDHWVSEAYQLPSQLQSIIALWPVSNYAA